MWEIGPCFISAFSLWAFPLQSLSLAKTDTRLASKTVPEACRSLEKPKERGLDTGEAVMRTEWQLTARPSCLSLPSPALSFSFVHTHTSPTKDMHPARPLPRWSLWVASGLLALYETLKFDATSLAGAKLKVWACGAYVLHDPQHEPMLTICIQQLIFFSVPGNKEDES